MQNVVCGTNRISVPANFMSSSYVTVYVTWSLNLREKNINSEWMVTEFWREYLDLSARNDGRTDKPV